MRKIVVTGLGALVLALSVVAPAAAQTCAPGKFGVLGMAPCFDCLAGTFSGAGATVCTPCVPGTFAALSGSPSCTPCPADTFAALPASFACTACPAGTTAPPGSAICTLTTTTTVPDPCAPNPCENGGTCQALIGNAYACLCPVGFVGVNCETPLITTTTVPDPCTPNPCQNGGTCQAVIGNAYACLCPVGFVGVNCETPLITTTTVPDPCTPNPCQNGGTCQTLVGNVYACVCPVGFIGLNCETGVLPTTTTTTLATTSTTVATTSTTVATTTTSTTSTTTSTTLEDTGVLPPDKNAVKCEDGFNKAAGQLAACIAKCHGKQASATLLGKPFDEEACETSDPAKSCRARYAKASAKLLGKGNCPPCLDAAASLQIDSATEAFVENANAAIYCAGSTPFGDDDPGVVPANKSVATCEIGVGKDLAKLAVAVAKCHAKRADGSLKSLPSAEEACEATAKSKYDTATAKLTTCPPCLDATARAALRDQWEAAVDQANGSFYCAGTAPWGP